MKALDIAIKDMKQAFRNLFAIAFMFLIPILVTTLFAFIFGGTGGDDEPAFQIRTIPVQVVSLDEGQLGGLLVDLLQIEELDDLLDARAAADAGDARRAVDAQEAQVAIIIPEDFSAALMAGSDKTEIELYRDPTLTLGPGIVSTLVNQFTISFSGSSILQEVVQTQLGERGLSLSPAQQQSLMGEYTQAVQQMQGEGGMLKSETPAGESQQNN
ncbi:MAG: ABC transporter permease, partial [Anaerolineales bacterium]